MSALLQTPEEAERTARAEGMWLGLFLGAFAGAVGHWLIAPFVALLTARVCR